MITEETLKKAIKMRDVHGMKWEEIAVQLGHSMSQLRLRYSEAKRTTEKPAAAHTPQVPVDAVNEMRDAYQRHQEEHGEDEEKPEEIWKREEDRSQRRIKKHQTYSTFRWRCPGRHMLLAFISDMHIAPGTPVDFRQMRIDAETIRSTPNCYAVLVGDQVDNHIKHRSAMLHAESSPDTQYQLLEYYLRLLGDRVILMISGNHDDWTKQFAGVDFLKRIAQDNRVWYAPDEAWLEAEVGSEKYVIAMRHQYRMNSSFNQTHSVKQWLRHGEREFDIGCIGHHHEAAIEQMLYRGKFRWVCRPGSYQITSAYSRQYGFNSSVPTTPCFLLRGDSHEVYGWQTVRGVASAIKALREIGV